jgi:signal transduction histidine kinase
MDWHAIISALKNKNFTKAIGLIGIFLIIIGIATYLGLIYLNATTIPENESLKWLLGGIILIGFLSYLLIRLKTFSQIQAFGDLKALMYSIYISLGYYFFGIIYIAFSTQWAKSIAYSLDHFQHLELFKGYCFIGLTGFFLLLFSYWIFRRILQDSEKIVSQKEALIEASKRATTGVFAASIAHDAGNILASLRFCLALLNRKGAFEGPNHDLWETMKRAIQELSELNRRLIKTGQFSLDKDIKVHELIQEIQSIITLARINQRVKNCEVTLEGDESIYCAFNSSLISEMILNLILNAADATNGHGKIMIYTYQLKQEVHIEVHDNGSGISDEIKEKIFTPFFTTKPHGTGLGLLTVKVCTEFHNGQLTIDRSPMLGGALFLITFPSKNN